MFPATLFDYNGVLVDDEHVHLAAFQDILAPLGFTLTEQRYWDEFLGLDDVGVFQAALSEMGMTPEPDHVAELVAAKMPRYLARAEGALVGFPGAADLVRTRAARGPVVIVSGALRPEIELGLEVLGIRDVVSGVISAEDVARSKPDPEGYVAGIAKLAELGVANGQRDSVVFEDSIDGIVAAGRAGLACVAIAHSYPADRLRETNAQRVVERIADVNDALLLELWEGKR